MNTLNVLSNNWDSDCTILLTVGINNQNSRNLTLMQIHSKFRRGRTTGMNFLVAQIHKTDRFFYIETAYFQLYFGLHGNKSVYRDFQAWISLIFQPNIYKVIYCSIGYRLSINAINTRFTHAERGRTFLRCYWDQTMYCWETSFALKRI